MARTNVTLTEVTRAGVTMPVGSAGDVANGNVVNNDGRVMIWAKNTNGASTSRTVTFHQVRGVDAQAAGTRVATIAAGVTQLFGPFSTSDYGEDFGIDVSNAEVLLAAIHMP
jgi:hypothetical protein